MRGTIPTTSCPRRRAAARLPHPEGNSSRDLQRGWAREKTATTDYDRLALTRRLDLLGQHEPRMGDDPRLRARAAELGRRRGSASRCARTTDWTLALAGATSRLDA